MTMAALNHLKMDSDQHKTWCTETEISVTWSKKAFKVHNFLKLFIVYLVKITSKPTKLSLIFFSEYTQNQRNVQKGDSEGGCPQL